MSLPEVLLNLKAEVVHFTLIGLYILLAAMLLAFVAEWLDLI